MTWTFLERDYQTYDLALRLFVEGVEVSRWLQDDVQVAINPGTNDNTLNFTLANPEDIWLLTTENIKGKWRKANNLYSEEAKKELYDRKSARDADAKRVMEQYKVHDQLRDVGLYGLGPDTPIFHRNDCVRLFCKHPLTPHDWWLCLFTGFLNTHPLTEDYTTGGRPLSLTCYCLKGIMRKMRVGENPIPTGDASKVTARNIQQKDAILGPMAGMFEDLQGFGTGNGLNHVLVGKNFEQCIDLLICGQGSIVGNQEGDKATIKLFDGLVTQEIFLPAGRGNRMGDKPDDTKKNDTEKKVIEKIAQLNGQDAVRSAGGVVYDGVVKWASESQRDTSFALMPEKDKSTVTAADRNIENWNKLINESKIRDKEEDKRKKAQGQPSDSQTCTANFPGTTETPASSADAPKNAMKRAQTPSSKTAMFRQHVGRFTKGQRVEFSPGPGSSLEEWHNISLLGNKGGYYLTYDQVTDLGKGTVLDNVEGSPFNGYVHMLLPKGGIPASTFVQANDKAYNWDMNSEVSFVSRLDLIERVCSQIEYQYYVSPWGDLIFEFPMFDFSPNAFGSWRTVLSLDKHAMNASMEDEAADVPTCLLVTGEEKSAIQETGNNGADGAMRSQNPNRTLVYAPLLATRLGAIVETMTAPVALGGAQGGTNQAQFEAWANLQLQKKLGAASTMGCPSPFRPWILPNRPYEHVARSRMGVSGSVQHSMSLGGVCSTTPNCVYVKKRALDGKYRYPTSGGENMPINYATMFTQAGDVTKSGAGPRAPAYQGTSDGTEVKPWQPMPKSSGRIYSDALMQDLRPEFQKIVSAIMEALKNKGWKPKIQSAYRSSDTQTDLYRKGKTTAPVSYHTYGLACDLIDINCGWPNPSRVAEDAKAFQSVPEGLMVRFGWPIQPPPKSTPGQKYGYVRSGSSKPHEGLDMGKRGDRVLASAAGTVTASTTVSDSRGRMVIIQHYESWETRYYHLDSSLVSKGDRVAAGQQIAVSGSAGLPSVWQAHLHFEVRRAGTSMDPMKVLDPMAAPSRPRYVDFYADLGILARQYKLKWGGDPKIFHQLKSSGWYAYGMGWDPVHIQWNNAPAEWKTDWKRGRG